MSSGAVQLTEEEAWLLVRLAGKALQSPHVQDLTFRERGLGAALQARLDEAFPGRPGTGSWRTLFGDEQVDAAEERAKRAARRAWTRESVDR